MADNANETKYFRTNILGLEVVVGEPEEGEVEQQKVRFTAYEITTEFGEPIRVAYLKTDNATAIKKLEKDCNVISVSKDEYKKYTDPKNDAVRRARV